MPPSLRCFFSISCCFAFICLLFSFSSFPLHFLIKILNFYLILFFLIMFPLFAFSFYIIFYIFLHFHCIILYVTSHTFILYSTNFFLMQIRQYLYSPLFCIVLPAPHFHPRLLCYHTY